MTQFEAGAIAVVCHEANRAYCLTQGDASQPRWEEAPEWQIQSCVAGVLAHLERPRTPEESHELWLAHKRAEGWTWGPVKDAEAKTHPCFLPYSHLPPEQQTKDRLFAAIVAALAPVKLEAAAT
jgi:hypothetical protein